MRWKELDNFTKEQLRNFKATYRKRAKFLVDENLGVGVKDYLKSIGFNVLFVSDIGLIYRDDKEIYQYARKHNRILLTHDHDYLDDREFPISQTPGIVVLPGAAGNERVLLYALNDLIVTFGAFGDFLMKTKLIYNADRTHRLRYINVEGKLIERNYKIEKRKVYELVND